MSERSWALDDHDEEREKRTEGRIGREGIESE